MSELKQYTLEEVSKHTTAESCWLIIGNEKNGEWEKVDLRRVEEHVDRCATSIVTLEKKRERK